MGELLTEISQMAFNETKVLGFIGTRRIVGEAFARKLIRVNKSICDIVLNEANVLNSLLKKGEHQNIINVLQHGCLGKAENVYFIDMELADFTLADYINYVFH